MNADIEQLVLSGALFNAPERSPSPVRTPSPDTWGQDDYASEGEADAARAKNAQIERMLGQPLPPDADAAQGQGRTGVKGVIADRDAARRRERERARAVAEETRRQMERAALSARTWREEEEERRRAKAREEGRALSDDEDDDGARRDVWGVSKGRFGHLREVGVKGFVDAVEERGAWVVIHLYDTSLERCFHLDDDLARLARLHPDVKFLRARAAALGFASTSKTASRPSIFNPRVNTVTRAARRIPGRFGDDSSDEDADEPDSGDEGEDDGSVEDDVDTDMLPTMLAYHDGSLVHNWVRVDWEAGVAGVEELLTKNHILSTFPALGGNCGLPLDDDELWISGEDD